MSDRYAHIVNGTVQNVIIANPDFSYGDGSLLVQTDTAQVGDTYANGVFTSSAPSAPVVVVPSSVALWQAKAALQAAGLLTTANTAVAAQGSPVTDFWASASNIDRTSPTLAGIATLLNLTPAQVDALFVQAASISL